MTLDEKMKNLGFLNLDHHNKMVNNVDLSTSTKQRLFREWQRHDGTKKVLANLIRSEINHG